MKHRVVRDARLVVSTPNGQPATIALIVRGEDRDHIEQH